MEILTGFEALPAALHLHILSFLPLVERVRCAPVAQSWKALLADPEFWAELRFDGAAEGSVDNAALQQLCRKAGGRLRALDVSAPACEAVTLHGLLTALASDGLGLALESLRTWAPADQNCAKLPPQRLNFDIAAATALAAACPALASAAVDVCCTYADAAAALRILPGPGEKRLNIRSDGASTPAAGSPESSLSALAEWASAALDGSSVAELELPFRGDFALPFAGVVEEQAAARLAAALTAPERGLQSLRFAGARGRGISIGRTPLLASLCRALTAESPLTELSLNNCAVTGAGAAEIAAVLAPGRSRLRTLFLCNNRLDDGGGGEALLSALGANTTLTALNLGYTSLGGPEAAAALAASLRRNSTLRTVHLFGSDLGSIPEGIASALSALASTTEAPSHCSFTALNIGRRKLRAAESKALGLTLAEPTCRLETLQLSNCSMGDLGGAAIARGLELAGPASRLRLLSLSENVLGDAAATALGRALAAQGPEGALRQLRLGSNRFGPEAAGHLAEGLRVNSSLETLDLGHNANLGSEGAAAIVWGIAGTGGTTSGVKTLSLANCSLGGAGVTAMLEAGLGQNATLTELNVTGNSLGKAGCLALVHWAGARFGVAPEEADYLPEGSGAQQRSALPSFLPSKAEAGAGVPPRPLSLRLSENDPDDDAEGISLKADQIKRIVHRANAAAAAAGWRYGGRRSALEISI